MLVSLLQLLDVDVRTSQCELAQLAAAFWSLLGFFLVTRSSRLQFLDSTGLEMCSPSASKMRQLVI